MSRPSKIHINDVTLRDGHQSLLATRMRIDDIVTLAKVADRAGFHALEVWGGATFDVAIRFKGEDPWKNLRQIKQAATNTPLMMLLRGQSLVGYKNYPDDVVEAFVRQAAENGITIFRIFDALNEMRNLKTAIRTVKTLQEEGQDVQAQGTICYSTSPVHTMEHFIAKAEELKDLSCDSVCIKDMAGLLEPDIARDLIPAVKKASGLPVTLHSHSTMGLSDATLLAAIEQGVDVVDTASRGLGGGPGHSATATLLELMNDIPSMKDRRNEVIDYDAVLEMDRMAREIRPKYTQWESAHDRENVEKLLKAQVPGGMLSNFESQIKAQLAPQGIDYKKAMDKILDEIPKVREELGWPPLVTPASQVVCVQAVLNVIDSYADKPRYHRLPEGTIKLLLGELGQTPATPSGQLVKKAEEAAGRVAITKRPADNLQHSLNKTRDYMADNGINNPHIEDVLTVALWDELGLSFVQNKKTPQKISSYEPPPRLPDSVALTTSYEVEGVSIIGPGDISKIAGLHRIEYIAQSMLELTKLTDGTWKHLDPKIVEGRIERAKERIHKELMTASENILSAVKDMAQKYGALELLNKIIDERCRKLGVTLPVPGIDPDFFHTPPDDSDIAQHA